MEKQKPNQIPILKRTEVKQISGVAVLGLVLAAQGCANESEFNDAFRRAAETSGIQKVQIAELQKEDSNFVAFRVRAVPQENGLGTYYLANGLTDAGEWYQAGTAVGEDGIYPVVQMYRNNGYPFLPPEAKGRDPKDGTMIEFKNFTINPNDYLGILLGISQGRIIFGIVNITTAKGATFDIGAIGSRFLGSESAEKQIKGPSKWAFTGIMLEQDKSMKDPIRINEVEFEVPKISNVTPYGLVVSVTDVGDYNAYQSLPDILAKEAYEPDRLGLVESIRTSSGKGLVVRQTDNLISAESELKTESLKLNYNTEKNTFEFGLKTDTHISEQGVGLLLDGLRK